jgi:hypothetical protein
MQLIRGRHLLAAVLAIATLRDDAAAALIRPSAMDQGAGSSPSLAASGGTIAYQYDPSAGTGLLTLNNNPYELTAGAGSGQQSAVTPDFTSTLHQILAVQLDSNGNLVTSAANQFELRGRVELGGQVYDGVLLYGRPVALGSQTLDSLGVSDTDFFDAKIAIDGGMLASSFGPDLYLRFLSTIGSTFNGRFDQSFQGGNALSQALPFSLTVPEPAPLVLIGSGLFWMLHRGRRARA